MSFWRPIGVLLRVRVQVARHHFERNPMAFLGTILLACVLALAALHLGSGLGAQWSALSTVAAGAGLQRLWMSMQGVWLAAMLLPVGIGILTQGPPQAALRPFALRPFQVFLADLWPICWIFRRCSPSA